MLSTNLTLTTEQAQIVLSRWLGGDARCKQIESLQGGMINSALRLTFDRPPGSAVVKLSTDPDSDELRSEQGVPTLIHEDIWAGNIMVASGKDGWHLSGLVDPSGSKFADSSIGLIRT